MIFAPGLVGTFSGGDDGGDGCHDPSPSIKGNCSWRGSAGGCARRRFSEGRRRFGLPSATSRSIGQPLAFCANERAVSAGQIVDTEADPVVMAEIKLSRIAMQVSFADMVIRPDDATLED